MIIKSRALKYLSKSDIEILDFLRKDKEFDDYIINDINDIIFLFRNISIIPESDYDYDKSAEYNLGKHMILKNNKFKNDDSFNKFFDFEGYGKDQHKKMHKIKNMIIFS